MRHDNAAFRAALSQAVRYFGAAGSMALFYLGIYAIGLAQEFHYFLAILIAQVITIAVAFPVYRIFVFRSRGRIGADFVRFASVWVSGALAGVIVTPVLVEVLRMDPFAAQVVAIVIVSGGSFLAHRLFTFRNRKSSPIDAPDPRGNRDTERSK